MKKLSRKSFSQAITSRVQKATMLPMTMPTKIMPMKTSPTSPSTPSHQWKTLSRTATTPKNLTGWMTPPLWDRASVLPPAPLRRPALVSSPRLAMTPRLRLMSTTTRVQTFAQPTVPPSGPFPPRRTWSLTPNSTRKTTPSIPTLMMRRPTRRTPSTKTTNSTRLTRTTTRKCRC